MTFGRRQILSAAAGGGSGDRDGGGGGVTIHLLVTRSCSNGEQTAITVMTQPITTC